LGIDISVAQHCDNDGKEHPHDFESTDGKQAEPELESESRGFLVHPSGSNLQSL
jgi:hypothetical protein